MRKLHCIMGNHHYKTGSEKFTFILEDDDSWIYRVENNCVDCGKHYCTLVNIPKPDIPTEENE